MSNNEQEVEEQEVSSQNPEQSLNNEEEDEGKDESKDQQQNEDDANNEKKTNEEVKQEPPRRIVITQPEEVFSLVPHARSKPRTDRADFSKSQPLKLANNSSHDDIYLKDNNTDTGSGNNLTNRPNTARNVNNRFSQTAKGPNRRPNPNPNAYRPNDANNRNRNRFSQTCPLNRPQSSRTNSTESLLSLTNQRTYTMTPELENLKKQAIEQEPLEVDDNSVLEDLLLLLSEERRQLAAQHDFKESQRRNDAIGYVMECQNWLLKLEAQKASMDDVQQRKEALDQQLQDFDIESREIRHRTKKKLRRKRDKLLKEQSVEVQALQELWSSEEKMRLYNKSSNTLICLRRQLALLLQQCRFDEAAAVQQQIDERQRLEETQNHNLMQQEFNEVFNKMKTRQSDDLLYFDQNAEMELKKLNRRREKLRQALVNREKKIQDKSDTAADVDKLWNAMKTNRTRDISKTDNSKTPMMTSLKVSTNDLKDEKMVQSLCLPPLVMPKYDPRSQSLSTNKKDDEAAKKKKPANTGKKK